MDPNLLSLLALVGGAFLAALAGGVLLLAVGASDRVKNGLLHVAAGVLLAVISVELWPDIREYDRAWATIAGLAAGGAAMIGLNALTRRLEEGAGKGGSPVGLVAATAIDSAVDGLLIGVGYAADPALGLMLAVGLAIEKFTLALTVSAELKAGGQSGRRVFGTVAAVSAPLVPAAAAGMLLLADAGAEVFAFTLSASAAALLYLATFELIVRGNEEQASPSKVICFFAGFAALASYAVLAPA